MTIAECIEWVAQQFVRAGLHFGHGTDNAADEAAWLVLHSVGVPLDGSFNDWGRSMAPEEYSRAEQLVKERCHSRKPLAYLLGTAWFAGYEFEVTRHVLVPRSPIAELIADGFAPWIDTHSPRRILDMCTGSGCIAIATALQFPGARVDAVDISCEALAVAHRNAVRHGVERRVNWIESDLFQAVPREPYDLIIANPPYVPVTELPSLPAEYRAEPGLGLESGSDGLNAVLSILLDAPRFLGDDGILVCEVGESENRLASLLPRVPFLWLEFAQGGSGVFVLQKTPLEQTRLDLLSLEQERENVV